MTDARLMGKWLANMRFDDLTDAAWRVFTKGLMWCAENGTNGKLPKRYLHTLHPEGDQPAAYDQIAAKGLWEKTVDGYQFLDWAGDLGQSTEAQVKAYKEGNRKRQADFRAKQKEAGQVSFSPTDRDVTRDVTGGVTRDVGKGKGSGDRNGYPEDRFDESAPVESDPIGDAVDALIDEWTGEVREDAQIRPASEDAEAVSDDAAGTAEAPGADDSPDGSVRELRPVRVGNRIRMVAS